MKGRGLERGSHTLAAGGGSDGPDPSSCSRVCLRGGPGDRRDGDRRDVERTERGIRGAAGASGGAVGDAVRGPDDGSRGDVVAVDVRRRLYVERKEPDARLRESGNVRGDAAG